MCVPEPWEAAARAADLASTWEIVAAAGLVGVVAVTVGVVTVVVEGVVAVGVEEVVAVEVEPLVLEPPPPPQPASASASAAQPLARSVPVRIGPRSLGRGPDGGRRAVVAEHRGQLHG